MLAGAILLTLSTTPRAFTQPLALGSARPVAAVQASPCAPPRGCLQPMANAAFYFLEPQAKDGFVGWSVLDETLLELGVDERPIVYPIFKYRRTVDEN